MNPLDWIVIGVLLVFIWWIFVDRYGNREGTTRFLIIVTIGAVSFWIMEVFVVAGVFILVLALMAWYLFERGRK